MTRKERKNQGIYKSNGKFWQYFLDSDGFYDASPLFDSPEEVKAWFKTMKIKPLTKPHEYKWG